MTFRCLVLLWVGLCPVVGLLLMEVEWAQERHRLLLWAHSVLAGVHAYVNQRLRRTGLQNALGSALGAVALVWVVGQVLLYLAIVVAFLLMMGRAFG